MLPHTLEQTTSRPTAQHKVPLVLAAVLVLCGFLVSTGTNPRVAAASTSIGTKCKGFADCSAKGYTNFGYSKDYKKSHWGAYAGHNCTNYIAWRLSAHDRSTDRPSKLGNASEWGVNAKAEGIPVAKTPRVGDVAWYSYHTGNSTRSHVAMVERVYSNGTILVSDDNWGGTFTWRVESAKRASGFIRFPSSNGSPHGFIKTHVVDGNKVTVTAYSEEADAPGRAADVLLTFGAPRGNPKAIELRLKKPIAGHWNAYRTFNGPAPTQVYVYALNTPGTPGKDVRLKELPPKAGTSTPPPVATTAFRTRTSLKLTKSNVSKKSKPKVKVRLVRTSTAAPFPGGVVKIRAGKKVVKTVKYPSGRVNGTTVTLPKLPKGKHKLTATFQGGGKSKASKSVTRNLRVK